MVIFGEQGGTTIWIRNDNAATRIQSLVRNRAGEAEQVMTQEPLTQRTR